MPSLGSKLREASSPIKDMQSVAPNQQIPTKKEVSTTRGSGIDADEDEDIDDYDIDLAK
jgi:hypothetical protein